MKRLTLVIIHLSLFFTFYACSSTTLSIYSTNSLASQDIDSLIQSHTNSLLSKGFVKKLKSQKVIAISDIENATGEKIDIDSLMTRFKNALSDEEKFVFSRAIAGSGSKIDTLLKDSRNLRNNEEFNQYTTKEKGELLAPDYSLSGKITKRTKPKGKNALVEYEFLLSLVDLSTGVEVWNNIAKVSKLISVDKASNLSGDDKQKKESKMSDEQFFRLQSDCLAKNKSACQALIDNGGLPSVKHCVAVKPGADARSTCSATGVIYYEAGLYRLAIDYCEKGIEFGEDYMYVTLGQAYWRNGNHYLARKSFEKGCIYEPMSQSEVISVSYSCYFAGLMYFNGEGAPQDYNIAVEYLEKACRFKHGEACTLLGFAYGNGKGVKQNYSIARQFIHKGCRFGSQRACDFYKELNQQGVR
ncbi:hypothetical protein ACWIWK_03115 [Helicobacter sp. 23-1048]